MCLTRIIQLLLVLSVIAGAGAAQPASEIHPGDVTESVQCRRSPTNSYALYLPSAYTPAKKWPIIYAFDPGAQGATPVRLYKDVAEKFGYIIAGSNDSENFNPRAQAA